MRALRILIGIVLLPAALFAAGVLVAPWSSWSARGYALGVLLVEVGAWSAQRRGLARGGVVLVALVAIVRVVLAARGATLTATTTAGGEGRLLTRVIDEGDMAQWGARLAFGLGHFRDPDTPRVPDGLAAAYREMRAAEGDSPSPVVPTYLGRESAERADVLLVEPARASASATTMPMRGAIVFLHGYGGSFALPCWQLAQAALAEGFLVACPSIGPRGDWWSAHGERVARDTIHMLNARGVTNVVLAGLSNGGVGAAQLAPKLRGAIRGLVLIAGTAPAADAGVPVLVLQGRRDAMMPAESARAYARAHAATYVELDGGHFAMLLERERAMRALRTWLAAR